MSGRSTPHVGDQLELELAGPGRAWLEPWGGLSPRVLTRTFKIFRLEATPPGGSTCSVGSEGPPTQFKGSSVVQLELPF